MQQWAVQDIRNAEDLATSLHQPASLLRTGGLVAFPTETVYGLGANAWDEAAVQRVFAAKNRPIDNPLIVHIAKVEDLSMVTPRNFQPTARMQQLMHAFWPGPLTLLVPAGPQLAPSVHPGLSMVGVRIPHHPVALSLIAEARCPVAAPSANKSGKPSPTSALDVREDFTDEIDGVIDGGACEVGLESTVIEVRPLEIVIYRPGGITREALQAICDIPVVYDEHLRNESMQPKAPGMKYRHYAPKAQVFVWQGNQTEVMQALSLHLNQLPLTDRKGVGLILPETWGESLRSTLRPTHFAQVCSLPLLKYAEQLGKHLYAQLRIFDRMDMHSVLIVAPPTQEAFTDTVMNRLQKAAEGRVVKFD
jgi:L-threonylcarbamoyladenylate synthase